MSNKQQVPQPNGIPTPDNNPGQIINIALTRDEAGLLVFALNAVPTKGLNEMSAIIQLAGKLIETYHLRQSPTTQVPENMDAKFIPKEKQHDPISDAPKANAKPTPR